MEYIEWRGVEDAICKALPYFIYPDPPHCSPEQEYGRQLNGNAAAWQRKGYKSKAPSFQVRGEMHGGGQFVDVKAKWNANVLSA